MYQFWYDAVRFKYFQISKKQLQIIWEAVMMAVLRSPCHNSRTSGQNLDSSLCPCNIGAHVTQSLNLVSSTTGSNQKSYPPTD